MKIWNNSQIQDKFVLTKVKNKELKSDEFLVTWKDLTYSVPNPAHGKRVSKVILNGVSGFFESSKVTAIMGPSGGGKSTLLACISKQKTIGVTGSITISTNAEVKFAFIAQDNYILDRLTVKESLMFASRLKNDNNADHLELAEEVIHKLNLESCADNRPSRCSGGQLKRVLIACELVSKPNILILDEPTSGLDSVTTWQLIHLLIELSQQKEPVAVVITIHQPSARLFYLLDQIYLMSFEGQCIYHGPPRRMQLLFAEIGLLCPALSNPSDFALEVASNEHGAAKLLTLSTINKIESMGMKENKYEIKITRKFKTFNHILILTERSIVSMIRDPFMIPMRIMCYLTCSILICLLWGHDSGRLSGCGYEFSIGPNDKDMIKKFKDIAMDLHENVALLGVVNLLAWFASIFPVLLVFPLELNVFLKEYGNGYYSVFSYFMSKVLSDLPFSLLLPNIASIIIYLSTEQYMGSTWRLINFAFIFILVSFNSSAFGFLLGSILTDYLTAIPFFGILTLIPMLLLSGLMRRLDRMPILFRWLSECNYMRYSLVSTIINSYGFGRCAETSVGLNQTSFMDLVPDNKLVEIYASDKVDANLLIEIIDSLFNGLIDGDRSMIMMASNIKDSDFYTAVPMMFALIVIFRLLTYYFIKKKIQSRS